MARRWGPALAWMAIIFYFSSLPKAPLPPHVSDTLGHAVGYGVLGLLVARGVEDQVLRLTWRSALLTLLITIAYGVSDELHQMFVPGRSPDVFDLLADATGGLVAVAACALWGILPIRSGVRGAAS